MRTLTLLVVLLVCCEARYIPEDGVYSLTEEMPRYDQGQAAFDTYVQEAALKSDHNGAGRVFVSFVVATDGSLKEAKAVNPKSNDVGQRAVQIIKEAPGNWIPGTELGKPVDVKMVYPVKF